MDVGYLFNWISREVFGVPAYLVGIMVAIALIASRKSWGDVLGGSLKAAMGFIILGIGANAVVAALTPLGTLITGVAPEGSKGVVPTNEAITAIVNANPAFGTDVAYAMFFGVILSLIIARLTPLRYVFLTGHHMLFMATVLTVVLLSQNVADWLAIVVGAVGLGTMMVVMPALAQPWMKRVTGGEPVAMGHFGTLGYILGGIAGQLVGRGSKSTEEMEFPQSLRFLRDPMLGTAIAMAIIYMLMGILFLLVQGEAKAVASDTGIGGGAAGGVGGFLMVLFNQALVFGGGVAVILLGVRTFLGEIVPAFSGIAERVIPGAVPALDCPVSFPYAPNAVLVGFLSSVVGGLVGFFVLVVGLGSALAIPLILPGMVPHFFTGGTAGVFGNATGGRRGAVAGGFVNGLFITLFAAFLVPTMSAIGFQNTTFGDADFQWFGLVVGNLARPGEVVAAILVIAACAVLVLFASWWQKTRVETGWTPGAGAAGQPAAAPRAAAGGR